MKNEKQTANNSEFEQSTREVLAEVSTKANEIIDNPNLRKSSDYSVKPIVMPDGSQETSVTSWSHGASLVRNFDPETGNSTYLLGVLYHSSEDRGSFNYSWSGEGISVLSAISSEMNGVSDNPAITNPREIKFIQSQLEQYFPTQQAEEIPVPKKKTFGSKLLAFLNK
jgi:hypothetical protein